MTKMMRAALLILLGLAVCCPLGAETTIVGWRGDGTGAFPTATPPREWSSKKNVQWKVPLAGAGYGAPIIVGDRLFALSDPAEVVSIRCSDGKVLWRKANGDIKAPPVQRGGFGRGGFSMGSFLTEPLLKALDSDKDGKVTKAELAAGVKKFFAKADKDKKGSLTKEQFTTALNAIMPQSRFGGGRRGGGGRAGRFGFGNFLADPIFKRADKDKTGKVTQKQLLAAAEALFTEVDKDKKGKLASKELGAAITLLMPARGGFGGGRGGFGRGGSGGFMSMSTGNTAATPVTDGKHIAALFGNGVAAVYTPEGKRLWGRFIESPRIMFGHSASPLLIQGKLIVHLNNLIALDVATGKEVWRAELRAAHASPVAGRLGKEDIVISPSGAIVRARDGKVLARDKFRLSQSSPVVQGDIICLFGETLEAHKLSQDKDGKVKVTSLWTRDGSSERYHMPSPVVHKGLIYGVTTKGDIEVLDLKTGKPVYRKPLRGGQVYSSVTLAGNLLYVTDTRGRTVVFKPGRKFARVAVNELEEMGSCPVFAGEQLYLRGSKHLFCVSTRQDSRKEKKSE
jgi:outer membrane protein assembly factor BamB